MLRYKLALISLGTLYFRLAIFAGVGAAYCCMLLLRFVKESYAQKFRETTL